MNRAQVHLISRLSAVLLMLVTSISALGNPSTTQAAEMVYAGQATMRVRQSDVYGRPLGWRNFTTNIELTFSAPRQARGLRETSPFALSIQSTPLTNQPGEFSIWSSMVFD
jgi:hypothetical protein